MNLETRIDDTALESHEITTALEIRHNDIYHDVAFVTHRVNGTAAMIYLCRRFYDCDLN